MSLVAVALGLGGVGVLIAGVALLVYGASGHRELHTDREGHR